MMRCSYNVLFSWLLTAVWWCSPCRVAHLFVFVPVEDVPAEVKWKAQREYPCVLPFSPELRGHTTTSF